jgi:phospholipase/lecithinase/hemolysin
MQRTPVFIDRGSEAISQEAAAISKYNTLLLAHLDDFKSSHTDASFKFLDTQLPFNQGLNNPTAYGAPDATCVNWDGHSCLWRDPYHPSVALQNLNAQYVRDQLSGWF